MTKLEDFLLPPNLIKNREEFIQEIDAIIDDGGITNLNLTLDEIQELESDKFHNQDIEYLKEQMLSGLKIPEDVIEEQRDLAELEDEEHYVDHEIEVASIENYLFRHPEFQGSDLQTSISELDQEITFQVGKLISEEIDKMIMESDELPDYLLNDSEIVGYPDEEFQNEIYQWVESKLPRFDRIISIKDLGAGRGDFYGYIEKGEIEFDYIGIDSNPNLIQVGQQKYPGIKLICNDFNDVSIQTDYTICIGTLNDDHGLNKWEVFNKTLNHALNNTKTAILFVLQANCYGEQGHLDYPISEVVNELGTFIRYEIDNSKIEDIYLLTVHIGGYK